MPTFKKLDCGCEVKENRLVSVCTLHGDYTRQHVERARTPREGVDLELQRQLVVALAPIVVSKADYEIDDAASVANNLHNQVHEIMRRMD